MLYNWKLYGHDIYVVISDIEIKMRQLVYVLEKYSKYHDVGKMLLPRQKWNYCPDIWEWIVEKA